jgi:diguanylate cyclase (GGDEF)-like protein
MLRLGSVGVCFGALLFGVSLIHYPLFHAAIEIAMIVAMLLTYFLATRSYPYTNHDLLLVVGNALPWVAVLDLLHLLAAVGALSAGSGAKSAAIALQLAIAGRLLEALTLCAAPLLLQKRRLRRLQPLGYGLITAALAAAVLWWRIFPAGDGARRGLTLWAAVSAYGIILLTAGVFAAVWRVRERISPAYFRAACAVLGLNILSLLCFSFADGGSLHPLANFGGHLCRALAYLSIVRFAVAEGLDYPYELMISRLPALSARDPLTGLSKREVCHDFVRRDQSPGHPNLQKYHVWVIHIVHPGAINERFGADAGEQMFRELSQLLEATVRHHDLLFRMDPRQFILVTGYDEHGAVSIETRIRETVALWSQAYHLPADFGIRIGRAVWDPDQPGDSVDRAVASAEFTLLDRAKAPKRPGPAEPRRR